MEINDFVKKFADCFHQTDPLTIKPNTEYHNLEEWGSMMTLIVIAMVDSDYGKAITAEDLKSTQTVAALYELISKK